MTPTGTTSPRVTLNGLSVLVVEDETIVSLLVETMLEELGCGEVWYASDVEEALDILARQTPDLAVLDVNLGGESAYPIAERLANAAVPFIFATGYGATGIHQDWTGRPVIQKPFQCEMLDSALRQALASRTREEVNP